MEGMVGDGLGKGGEFFPDHVLVPQPAVGLGAVFPLDSRWWWRFRSVRLLLSTSAVVANRFVTVDITDAEGNAWVRNPAPAVQAAGVANQEYNFADRSFTLSGIAGQPMFSDLLKLWIPPGWQLRVNVANIDAGDQLAGIRLYVDKLLTRSD